LGVWGDFHRVETVVLSGGVFQNELLLRDMKHLLDSEPLRVWTNRAVPPNDGGISLLRLVFEAKLGRRYCIKSATFGSLCAT
jgi:hydrogenase maturation factor HypF (carbamoyltransferase family)